MMTSSALRSVAVIAALLCGVTVARAIERTKIPAFAVTGRDGRSRSSESLQRGGQWLLVVVHPSCKPCDTVLQAVAALPPEPTGSRLVIVISSGTAADVAALVERYPSLTTAEWLTGAAAEVNEALKLTAASALFGVRGNMIEWSVSGVLNDPADVRSIAASWLATAAP